MDSWLADLAATTQFIFETAGIAVIILGSILALSQAAWAYFGRGDRKNVIYDFRSTLGRSILLGLEFLVAGDIINTVAFEPNLNSVAVLAGIVLIRTFLSFSIELEIEGKWPWQKSSSTNSGD